MKKTISSFLISSFFLFVSTTTCYTGTARITYNGGPVLSNVGVFVVYWGNNVNHRDDLDVFYDRILNGSYVSWLSEYSTPKQCISGHGMFDGSFTITDGGALLNELVVRDRLSALLDEKQIASNTPDRLYVFHTAPGVDVTLRDLGSACGKWCGYHSSFFHDGKPVYYAVVPSMGDDLCAQNCGHTPGDEMARLTYVASHELVEAITDPTNGKTGEAGWYDSSLNDGGDEIADTCRSMSTIVDGYVVQMAWSNAKNACTAGE